MVHVVTADESAAACPSCGVISTARKSSATTHPRDVAYGPDPVRLVWHKSRWRCRESLCERGSFTESLPQGPTRCNPANQRRRIRWLCTRQNRRVSARENRVARLSSRAAGFQGAPMNRVYSTLGSGPATARYRGHAHDATPRSPLGAVCGSGASKARQSPASPGRF